MTPAPAADHLCPWPSRGLRTGRAVAVVTGRLLACAVLLVGLSACAGTRPPAQADLPRGSTLDQEMFSVAYERILDYHVADVSLESLARDATQSLQQTDPALSVEFTADAVRLMKGSYLVATYDHPGDLEADRWGRLTADLLAQARAVSPAVAALDSEAAYEVMMAGLVESLDPYSRYISAKAAQDERGRRSGYGGVGLTFEKTEDQHRVITVFDDGPAAAVGILPGDVILSVNGVEAGPLTPEELGDRVRGPEGTTVIMAMRRGERVRQYELKRGKVIPTFITSRVSDGVIIIQLTRFTSETAEKLEALVRSLLAQQPRPRAMVLDLRGNPGGLLDQAVEVVSLFLDRGPVISTRGRHPGSFQRFSADSGEVAPGVPMVVLIDGRSASASEVVAAALQENGRALIAGSSSYGKGSVQTVTRLPNGGELLLTWSLIYTPRDFLLHEHGVTPYLCMTDAERPDVDSMLQAALEAKPTVLALRRRGPRDEEAIQALRALCPPKEPLADTSVDAAVKLLNMPQRFQAALAAANDELAEGQTVLSNR